MTFLTRSGAPALMVMMLRPVMVFASLLGLCQWTEGAAGSSEFNWQRTDSSGPLVQGDQSLRCFNCGPETLKKGDQLKLLYRAIIHPERWDAERLKQEARRFAGDGR